MLKRLGDEPSLAETPVIVVTSRDLSQAERVLLLQRASEIVDKRDLEKTDFGAVIRRAIGETTISARVGL